MIRVYLSEQDRVFILYAVSSALLGIIEENEELYGKNEKDIVDYREHYTDYFIVAKRLLSSLDLSSLDLKDKELRSYLMTIERFEAKLKQS